MKAALRWAAFFCEHNLQKRPSPHTPKFSTVANATARQNHQKTRQKRDSKWSFMLNKRCKTLSINILFLVL
jgi:hypothetical protein